jgi:hypothetical protein
VARWHVGILCFIDILSSFNQVIDLLHLKVIGGIMGLRLCAIQGSVQ